jgi:hypothetical protein
MTSHALQPRQARELRMARKAARRRWLIDTTGVEARAPRSADGDTFPSQRSGTVGLLRAFSTSPTARDGMISEGTEHTMKHHDPLLVAATREVAAAKVAHSKARASGNHARAVEAFARLLAARLELTALQRFGARGVAVEVRG